MAVDFLLLQRYPEEHAAAPRFRHYGWRGPAFTFGYSQKIAFVREQLAPVLADSATRVDLCRRPTGGGIVDHREDWTYALVIPRGHPLEELRASESYRTIHEAVAEALRAQDVPALVKPCDEACDPETTAVEGAEVGTEASTGAGAEKSTIAGICFTKAETFDVVHAETGAKIAGAAQKRNKHGLLFQGSIWKPSANVSAGAAAVDWDLFEEALVEQLAAALGVEAQHTPWPEFAEDEVEGLSERYASVEWNEYR